MREAVLGSWAPGIGAAQGAPRDMVVGPPPGDGPPPENGPGPRPGGKKL